MKEKNSKDNKYVGFELLSLQCTQYFCVLPAIKLYSSQRITPWSTTMLLILEAQGVKHWVYVTQRSLHFMGICFITVLKANGRCFRTSSCLLSQVCVDQNKAIKPILNHRLLGIRTGRWITADKLTESGEKTRVKKYSCDLVLNRLSSCYLY